MATQSSRMGDSAISHRIEELQEQCEYYTKRIEVERRRSEELQKKLKISRLKMNKLRTDAGGLDGAGSQVQHQRKLSLLEHRLDKMSVRLNQAVSVGCGCWFAVVGLRWGCRLVRSSEAVCHRAHERRTQHGRVLQQNHNKKMKLEIEDLRREKMQRENIKKKLEREVKNTKRSMLTVIQESQQATDARDKAERLAAELEQLISSEMVQFEAAFQKRMNVRALCRVPLVALRSVRVQSQRGRY